MPAQSLIVGVDLAPIKPIPRCITFQSDITTDKCRATLRQHLKHFKADCVLHDGAPNVGTAWVQDAFTQAELVLQSMKLATEFLAEGGTFVTKIFRSKDYNSLLWVFNQLFMKVEATKPPSSRNVSAEIFVVCRGYKAPKHLDPKFLDARNVFAELAEPAPNNEAKVFKPEIKKRKRGGYEEGDWTQFHEVPVSEFIQTSDPIAMLGSLNKLSFEQPPNGDVAIATIDKLKETTKEVRNCCADLKVLGRADFKRLLRWRLKVREIFGFASKKKDEENKAKEAKEAEEGVEIAEIEDMDDEMKIAEELEKMKEKDSKTKRKQRRIENERKQKEIVRMQMNMTTPYEIGLEQAGPQGEDSMFALKAVDKAGALSRIAKGKMATIVERERPDESSEEEQETDDEGDYLERDLDDMYGEYVEQRSARDAKYRAKRAKNEGDDGEWNGFSDDGKAESSDDELVQDEDSDWSDDEEGPKALITDLDNEASTHKTLTKRAERFFDQDIFKGIDGLDDLEDDDDSGIDLEGDVDMDAEEASEVKAETQLPTRPAKKTSLPQNTADSDSSDDEDKIEEVKRDESQWEQDDIPMKNGKPDIDIITAEAMTLAHQMATGKKTKYDLLDDSFNRYSLRDVDGLPDWFLDDENRHSKMQRPVTAAGAAAIKEKLRALNARPIKKVREAQARKKFKAAQRLEKLKKKSALLADEEGMTEKEKAQSIARLMSRAAKKKPKQKVNVVVARGGNKGIKSRPKGTKGKYKMVDARLKKDVRGEKRAAKKRK
jgi:AdoMet-dependent rRNA methyltransferase SPB1